MKIYIMTDQEGTSGMTEFERRDIETVANYFKRRRIRELQTEEIKAAIDGLMEAGATEVIINDAHGSGYNILFEYLPPIARVIHGDPRYLPFWMPLLDSSFDAMIFTGAHPMEGTEKGILPHTRWEVNGIALGEVGMAMALAGYFKVPTVFVSGDAQATEEAKRLVPNIETAAVKQAFAPTSALEVVPAKAREMIKEGARRGLERLSEIEPYFIEPPYEVRVGEKLFEGDDFYGVIYEALTKGYGYKYGVKLRREGLDWVPEE